MRLEEPVTVLKGVGEQRARRLNRLGIYTLNDLLTHYPREYKNRSQLTKLAELEMDRESTFIAQYKGYGDTSRHGRYTLTRLRMEDETGSAELLWYNRPYMKTTLAIGEWYLFTGRLQKKYGRKDVVVSEWERIGDNFAGGCIVPVYPACEGVSQKMLRGLIASVLEETKGQLEEEMPLWVRKEHFLAEKNFAVSQIHFPNSEESFFDARKRLVFEELFMLQGALLSLKAKIKKENTGIVMEKKKALAEFQDKLPFPLTGAQKRVLKETERDMSSGAQMSRLVQGDVGSGKTAVAMALAYWVIQNGYQAALMAPTEVLARQHYESFSEIYDPLGIETVLLTGAQSAKEKRTALEKISSGEGKMIIGTHAVIQKGVTYNSLGLAVTDEQHRFGVRQRSTLSKKGEEPHILVMTATPIPRTLALMIYGDMDISIIDELPPGRQKTDTIAVDGSYRRRVYDFIKRETAAGRQAYIICPMIEEGEKAELQAVTAYTDKLMKELKNVSIACVHGKMKPKEKQETMDAFVQGGIQVLVATTVIEVGINVPNATIMVIENAERFGLAQLHQLRGRVGRGAEKSYCILFSDSKTKTARERLKALVDSNDGFVISEKDLKLRGPGDFFGFRQHGLPELKIANIYEDMSILKEAQEAAKKLLEKDPELRENDHRGIRDLMEKLILGKSLDI